MRRTKQTLRMQGVMNEEPLCAAFVKLLFNEHLKLSCEGSCHLKQ